MMNANLKEYEPVEACSNSNDEENICQVTSIKHQKLHNGLKQKWHYYASGLWIVFVIISDCEPLPAGQWEEMQFFFSSLLSLIKSG